MNRKVNESYYMLLGVSNYNSWHVPVGTHYKNIKRYTKGNQKLATLF